MAETKLTEKENQNRGWEAEENLAPKFKYYGKTKEEQIVLNQKGLEVLQAWREEDAGLTKEEIEEAKQTWELVKRNIDEHRSRQLFF